LPFNCNLHRYTAEAMDNVVLTRMKNFSNVNKFKKMGLMVGELCTSRIQFAHSAISHGRLSRVLGV
jgi:hypothetical protein